MDSIKDKAMEMMGLNDTSIDAKLYLNGKVYSIDVFDIQFQQSFDFKGEPQREVRGGLLTMTFNQTTDEQLNYWMFHNDVKYSGSIVFASFSMIESPVIKIDFVNGRCARYTKSIGESSLSLTITITAQKITINGREHKNNPRFDG